MYTEEEMGMCIKALVKAFEELNTIRACDGVPYHHDGTRSAVGEEYFSSVVDEIDFAVTSITGISAHCNPLLYSD